MCSCQDAGLLSDGWPPASLSEGRRAVVCEMSEDDGGEEERHTKIRVVGNHLERRRV